MDDLQARLAANLVNYSTGVGAGDRVLVWGTPDATPLMELIAQECRDAGGVPYFLMEYEPVAAAFLRTLTVPTAADRIAEFLGSYHYLMDRTEVFIGLRGKYSDTPYDGIDEAIQLEWQKGMGRLFRRFTSEKRWAICDWPTPLQAAKAGMDYDSFFEYVMRVSALDYRALEKASQPLYDLVARTDRVHITGRGTDLAFSIKDIGVVMGAAKNSYIDGEVYTAPVKDSIEGVITYTVPSVYMGHRFAGVRFEFEGGRIVKASCEEGSVETLNRILDTDEGGRYIGEFALGTNPEVTVPMNDIHYDEKIVYSFHLTPGQCYDDAPNGNHSAVHWDLVSMQTPEYGGGEIRFDGVVIKKDGLFVHPDLTQLNPARMRDA